MVQYHQLFQCLGQLNGTELPRIMRTDSLDSSFPEMCPLCQEDESEVVLLEGPGSPSSMGSVLALLLFFIGLDATWGMSLFCHFSLTFAWVGQWGSGLEWEGNQIHECATSPSIMGSLPLTPVLCLSFEPSCGGNSSFWPQNEP